MKHIRKTMAAVLAILLLATMFPAVSFAAATLKITAQPKNVAVTAAGELAVFSLTAEGDGLSYAWYYKDPGQTAFSKSASVKNYVQYTTSADRNGREVYCVVSDASGQSVQSETVELTIGVRITQQPQNVVVQTAGTNAEFRVSALGKDLTYAWYYKDPGQTSFTKSASTTNSVLYKTSADRNGREVYCVVTDSAGNAVQSDVVTLTVGGGVKITEQPRNASVQFSGELAEFRVAAEGDGLTYAWYYRDPGQSAFTKSASTNNYILYKTSLDRNGREVYCVVSDMYGYSVQSNVVKMTIGGGVKITSQPQNTVVQTAGALAEFRVEAEGDGLTYAWYYKDPGQTSFTKSASTNNYILYKTSAERNGRQVYCVVTDSAGNSVQSDTVVMKIGGGVKITSQPQNAVVQTAGTLAEFRVEAEGEGLTYAWYYKDPGQTSFSQSTSTNNYILYNTSADRNGREVYCVVSDKYGFSVQSDTVVLTIGGGVKITAQPQDVTVTEGVLAEFRVEAEGEGLTYAWYYKDAGQTEFTKSASAIASVRYTTNLARNGRQVYCVVSDKYGYSAQSETVTLTVRAALKITAQPVSLTVKATSPAAAFTVGATGTGLTYAWYYKDPGAAAFVKSTGTGSTILYNVTLARSGREIYCVITDAYGATVKSDTVTLTLDMAPAGLQVTASGTSATLSWTAVPGATAYDVYVCAEGETEPVLIGTSSGTSYTVEGGAPNTTYALTVQAVAVNGDTRILSAMSAPVSAKTECAPAGGHLAGEPTVENAVQPTCTEDGSYDLVVRCAVCGMELSREACVVAAPGHKPKEKTIENVVEPTCIADGSLDEVIRCENCNEILASETITIGKVAHIPGEPVIENEIAATCMQGGSYDEVVYCQVGREELSRTTIETEPDPLNHEGERVRVGQRTPTCVSGGNTGAVICSACEMQIEAGQHLDPDPTNHVGETELRGAVAATCSQVGYTGDIYCLDCGNVKEQGSEIAKLEHTLVTDSGEPANCGYPGKTEGSHCSVCGEVIVAQTVIPATGNHGTGTYRGSKSATNCTMTGYRKAHYVCPTCGKLFKEASCKTEYDPADIVYTGKHSWSSNIYSPGALISEPTCTSGAVYYKTCTYCGKFSDTETVTDINSRVGHNYQPNPNHVSKAATCTSDAVYFKDCVYCGETNGTEIMFGTALGHNYTVIDRVVAESTCAKKGEAYFTCSRCGNKDTVSTHPLPIAPDNHPEASIQTDMTDVIAPTCTSAGEYYSSSVCKACGKTLSRNEYHVVDKLPHNLRQIAAKAATCTSAGNIAYYQCYDCGGLFADANGTQAITAAATQIAALGHRASGVYERVYSRQTTCTVSGIYTQVMKCANGCGTVMDTKPAETEAPYNHMINGQSAYEYVPAAAATCTEPAHTDGYRCTLCGAVKDGGLQEIADQPALGHDFSVANNILDATADGFFCSRCGAQHADLLGTFNTLVNAIKRTGIDNYNYNHVVATFGKTVTKSNYNRFKSTGIVNILSDVKSQFDQEMKRTETDYSTLYSEGWIRGFLYLKNNDVVSLLENSDVRNVTVQKQSGLNFGSIIDSSYLGQYKDESGNDKVAPYRNMSVSGDVVAVTVTLRTETYKPSTGISGVSADGLTSLQKLMDKDIRILAEQYGPTGVMTEQESDTGYEMSSTMALRSIVSDGNVTFYFKASNYEPIAAVYNSTIVTSQDVSMSIKLGISSGSISVDPYVTETAQDIFLFFPG